MDTDKQAGKVFSIFTNFQFSHKFSDLFRYLSLSICGFAVGSIYNAIRGYVFSAEAVKSATRLFISPISAAGEKDAFSVISAIISGASADGIFLLMIFIAGLSVVCDAAIGMTLTVRGLNLAILTGILAENADVFSSVSPHPVAATAVILTFNILNSVALIIFAAITYRGTAPFRQTVRNERDVIFSRRFLSMTFTALCVYGAQIFLGLFRGLLLTMISRI